MTGKRLLSLGFACLIPLGVGCDEKTSKKSPEVSPNQQLMQQTLRTGNSARFLLDDFQDTAARFAFLSSSLNGFVLTTTGTLSQRPGEQIYDYESQPTDRLRMIFEGGDVTDIFFESFDGELGDLLADDYLGFLEVHNDFGFTYVNQVSNVQVRSQAGYVDENNQGMNRSAKGAVRLNDQDFDIELFTSQEFTFIYDFDTGYSYQDTSTSVQGRADSVAGTIEIDDSFRYKYESFDGNSVYETYEWFLGSKGRTSDGVIFSTQDAYVRWNYIDALLAADRVAEGTLLEDGTSIGSLEFRDADTAVTVLRLDDGTTLDF